MNIYKYNDLIFVEGNTKSGYLRPFDAKTMTMRGAGSASTYEKYRSEWQHIGTLGKTHRLDGNKLIAMRTPTTTNRSVSFSLTLLERLDKIAKDEERSFSWLVNKLILKGLGDDKN